MTMSIKKLKCLTPNHSSGNRKKWVRKCYDPTIYSIYIKQYRLAWSIPTGKAGLDFVWIAHSPDLSSSQRNEIDAVKKVSLSFESFQTRSKTS